MLKISNRTSKKLDIVVNTASFSTLCEGALAVISEVSSWKSDDISFKLFTSGYTNHLLKCYLKTNTDEALLIRVYGEKTEIFIDRDVEIRNIQMMYEAGLCPPLQCAFTNGLCYDYTPGEVIDVKMVRDPDISKMIAVKIARMHNIQANGTQTTPQANIFSCLYKLLQLIPESFADQPKDTRYKSIIGTKEKLNDEISCLKEHLSKLESPVVFCHNDLLLKNIIYNRKKKEVTFIDYEYGDFNYQAYDIGNHFCEFAGVENYDPGLYPNREFQLCWLKNYLEAWYFENRLNHNEITEETIEKLYIAVNKFSLASHMYWGIWALVQSTYSKLDLDYLWYAKQRLHEYFLRKEEYLAL